MIFDLLFSRYILLIPYGFISIIVLWSLVKLFTLWRRAVFPRSPQARLLDGRPPMPTEVAERARMLETRGFTLTCAAEITGSMVYRRPYTEWCYTSDDGGTVAELNPAQDGVPAGVGLITHYADDALLITTSSFGTRETIRGRFAVDWAAEPAAALVHHAEMRAAWDGEHGPPIPLNTFAAWQAATHRFEARYRGRYLRRVRIQSSVQIIMLVAYQIAFTAALVLEWTQVRPGELPGRTPWLITAAVGVLFVNLLTNLLTRPLVTKPLDAPARAGA